MSPLAATPFFELLKNREFFEAILQPFESTLGLPLLSLLVFGGIGFAQFQRQGASIIPVVSLLMIGGVVLIAAPPQVQRLAIVAITLALTGIGYLAFRRISR
jgi:hypothetical protein